MQGVSARKLTVVSEASVNDEHCNTAEPQKANRIYSL